MNREENRVLRRNVVNTSLAQTHKSDALGLSHTYDTDAPREQKHEPA